MAATHAQKAIGRSYSYHWYCPGCERELPGDRGVVDPRLPMVPAGETLTALGCPECRTPVIYRCRETTILGEDAR